MKFFAGDKVVITSLLNPSDPLTVGETYDVVGVSANDIDFIVIGDDGYEVDVSPCEAEHVSHLKRLQENNDKPMLDALRELNKRIKDAQAKVDELTAIRDAIKKLREEG